jgi:hypothetical protein
VHEDDILDWDSEPIHNSRPPLRWIAEEDGNKFKAKLYCKIFDAAYPFYQKYGTFYKIKWNNED